MKYTFQLPTTGEITIKGKEEDLRMFLLVMRGCVADAITYNIAYCNCKWWAEHLQEVYNCLPDPSPYADPTLDLPY